MKHWDLRLLHTPQTTKMKAVERRGDLSADKNYTVQLLRRKDLFDFWLWRSQNRGFLSPITLIGASLEPLICGYGWSEACYMPNPFPLQ